MSKNVCRHLAGVARKSVFVLISCSTVCSPKKQVASRLSFTFVLAAFPYKDDSKVIAFFRSSDKNEFSEYLAWRGILNGLFYRYFPIRNCVNLLFIVRPFITALVLRW